MESKAFTHIIIIHKDKNMGKGVNSFIKYKEELQPKKSDPMSLIQLEFHPSSHQKHNTPVA